MANTLHAAGTEKINEQEITAALKTSNPLVMSVEFHSHYVVVELASDSPNGRTRFFVLYDRNWYVQFHNAGASAVKFSRQDALDWIEKANAKSVRTSVAQATPPQSVAQYRTCPTCGATSSDANFTTCPPYCDDCA